MGSDTISAGSRCWDHPGSTGFVGIQNSRFMGS
jgi:hypothetical protein